MLLEFKAKNYKSFADEMNFSMFAAPRQLDLNYSLFKGTIGGKKYRVQCSSVVYGPNAGGKTNIIGAMDTFRAIILKGNLQNSESPKNFNIAATSLELIPNINKSTPEPVEFTVEFIEDSLRFKYILTIDIGSFLNTDYTRKIISEELHLNEKPVFKRSERVELGDCKHIQKYLLSNQPGFDKTISIINGSLNPEELFLTNGFKVIISPELSKIFINWISKKFMIIYRADSVETVRKFSESDEKGIYTAKTTNEAAKIFGANSNKIGYVNNKGEESEAKLCSILETNNGKTKAVISAEVFESYGTVRFVNLFPIVLNAFANGSTLVIDEFDASIHPSALMNIINMFHNDSINKNHAQLIFNTHNPIFLNSNLFRRDEIKFVQRNPDTGSSELYSLSDFGTAGKEGVRNSTDYMKYYLNYSYGAIEDVDFAPVFEKIADKNE